MRARRYFERIDWFNLPYALWLSLRYDVYGWKLNVPRFLAAKFRSLRAFELFDRDEWLLLRDTCFDLWKADVFPHLSSRYRLTLITLGLGLDYSRILWQMLGARFEQYYLFTHVVHRNQERDPVDHFEVVAPWVAHLLTRGSRTPFAVDETVPSHVHPINLFLEYCSELSITLGYLGRAIACYVSSLFDARSKTSIPAKRIFWTGISAQEIPFDDDQLDFAWAVKYGPLERHEVLYLLSHRIQSTQKAYLRRHKIDFLEPHKIFSPFSRWNGARILFRAIATAAIALVRRPWFVHLLLARLVPNSFVYHELAIRLGTKFHFTTTSHCWPERAELPAMNALGIRTIIWGYSANNLQFAKNTRRLRDLGVYRSFFCADEFWVWNSTVRTWLERRQIELPERRTIFSESGILMCGDRRHMSSPPQQVRSRINLPNEGFLVSVFDVTAVNLNWQKRFSGGPPMIPLEYSSAFFATIRRLLDSLPELRVLLKLKRDLSDRYRAHPETLRSLLDDSNAGLRGRVFLVDPNVDPYLPIAACNGAIGMLYTSPVLVALSYGRFGSYYDPLGLGQYPTERSYLKLTARNENELLDLVKSWMKMGGSSTPPTDSPLIPDRNTSPFDAVINDLKSTSLTACHE